MRISLALTFYNSADFLPFLLNSLLLQSRLPDEVVACDDASSDGSWEILKDFQNKAPFPVMLTNNSKKLGAAKNLEKVCKLCCGDIIAICDSDDIWFPDKLLHIEKAFRSGNAGAVFSDGDVIDVNGRTIARSLLKVDGLSGRAFKRFKIDPFSELMRGSFVPGPLMAFRSRFLSDICPIPKDWGPDYWIIIIISLISSIGFIDNKLISYRRRVGSDSYNTYHYTFRNRRYLAVKSLTRSMLRFKKLKAHVESMAEIPDKVKVLHMLDEKIAHLSMRSRIYRSEVCPTVALSDLFKGRYFHYSKQGLIGCCADLLWQGRPAKNHC